MTEQEWLACNEPEPLIIFRRKASERKLRLFAVACCRRILHLLPDSRSQDAIEIAEREADGKATRDQLKWACDDADSAIGAVAYAGDAAASLSGKGVLATSMLAADAMMYSSKSQSENERHTEERKQCDLLRDIFGNPFRPVAISPTWQTPTVVSLAQVVYDERAFDRMPILGDALEDAGCQDRDILDHCRQPGEHVRGCWVVDLLLGKK